MFIITSMANYIHTLHNTGSREENNIACISAFYQIQANCFTKINLLKGFVNNIKFRFYKGSFPYPRHNTHSKPVFYKSINCANCGVFEPDDTLRSVNCVTVGKRIR